jgi:hypothetical protein
LREPGPGIDGALAALEASLGELARDRALDPDEPHSMAVIREQMDAIVALPGGAAALVARYGADERPAIVRPLAFLLAVAVNRRDGAHALAATTFALIEALRTPDPWPRLNLCTAIQRLLMFDAVGALDPARAAGLVKLLHESLASVPAVRAVAATVVADLCYRPRAALPAADLDGLRQAVLALVDDPDELTRNEARGLRDLAPAG